MKTKKTTAKKTTAKTPDSSKREFVEFTATGMVVNDAVKAAANLDKIIDMALSVDRSGRWPMADLFRYMVDKAMADNPKQEVARVFQQVAKKVTELGVRMSPAKVERYVVASRVFPGVTKADLEDRAKVARFNSYLVAASFVVRCNGKTRCARKFRMSALSSSDKALRSPSLSTSEGAESIVGAWIKRCDGAVKDYGAVIDGNACVSTLVAFEKASAGIVSLFTEANRVLDVKRACSRTVDKVNK